MQYYRFDAEPGKIFKDFTVTAEVKTDPAYPGESWWRFEASATGEFSGEQLMGNTDGGSRTLALGGPRFDYASSVYLRLSGGGHWGQYGEQFKSICYPILISSGYYTSLCGDRFTSYLDADINRDCYVNLGDFALTAADWGKCTDPCNPDCDEYWREPDPNEPNMPEPNWPEPNEPEPNEPNEPNML